MTRPNRTLPTGYSDVAYYDCDMAGEYAYGIKSSDSQQLWRRDRSGVETMIYDFDNEINGSVVVSYLPTSVAGEIVVQVNDSGVTATAKSFLYKSVDDGVTWTEILKLGELSSVHAAAIPILSSRGWCETADGTWYAAEYNINSSRVAGSTNDQCRIWKSTDRGDTWTTPIVWNTDGANNNMRHVHCIREDDFFPNTTYVGTGDAVGDGAVIQWDGASPLTNVEMEDVDALSGFKSFPVDSKKVTTTDFLFTRDRVVTIADNQSLTPRGDRGAWWFTREMNEYHRSDDHLEPLDGHAGFWGLRHSSGTLLWSTITDATGADDPINIYASIDDGLSWDLVSRYATAAGTTGTRLAGFFEFNGEIYASCTRGAGKDFYGTTIFTLEGQIQDFQEDGKPYVLPIHPVYWVDKNGSDANSGYSPDDAWLTLDHALEGQNITHSARVMVGEGDFVVSSQIIPAWDSLATRPAPSAPTHGDILTFIEGVDKTLTQMTAPTGQSELIQCDGNEHVAFVRMHLRSQEANRDLIDMRSEVHLIDCILGDRSLTASDLIVFNSGADYLHAVRTKFHAATANGSLVRVASAPANGLFFDACIFEGGNECINIDVDGVECRVRNSAFFDYDQRGISYLSGTATNIPSIQSCYFNGGGSIADVIVTLAVDTDNRIDYNYYVGSTSGMDAGSDIHSITGASLFADADAMEAADVPSVLQNKGGAGYTPRDYAGNKFSNPPSLGVKEHNSTSRKPATRAA